MALPRLRVLACSGAAVLGLLLAMPAPASAYIGPGAGFALLSSVFVFFTTVVLAALALVAWPFRMARRRLRAGPRGRAVVRRLVIVGFDGQDPALTERWLESGKLPHLRRLAEQGSYQRLKTTCPAVSPVAWSSFTTGTNPAKHNIFDFLDRDKRTYLPVLSSSQIGKVERFLRIGGRRIPLARAELRRGRKSKPFWSVLGEHGIWSTILRVPITFPPDRFYGAQLSAMSVPDLRGTQGAFTFYSTRMPPSGFKEGGSWVQVEVRGERIETTIAGPDSPMFEQPTPLEVSLRITLDPPLNRARVDVGGVHLAL